MISAIEIVGICFGVSIFIIWLILFIIFTFYDKKNKLSGKKIFFTENELNAIYFLLVREQNSFRLNHEGQESEILRNIMDKLC